MTSKVARGFLSAFPIAIVAALALLLCLPLTGYARESNDPEAESESGDSGESAPAASETMMVDDLRMMLASISESATNDEIEEYIRSNGLMKRGLIKNIEYDTGWVIDSAEYAGQTGLAHLIVSLDVPVIYQYYELPTGCESVALTEVLNYYGFDLATSTIADDYMPWSGSDFVYAFLGNPHSGGGNAIMAPGLTDTANLFLEDVGSDMQATNLTGASFSDLYEYLDRGIPVVVWNTIDCATPSGPYMSRDGYSLYYPSHTVTLAGYNLLDNTVYIADPISGWVERDADWFETVYDWVGMQAVVIE